VLAKVEYENYLGEATALWNKAWDEFQVRVAQHPRLRRFVSPRQLLLVPSLAWYVLFFLAPLVLVGIHSFGQISLITFDMHFGWTLQNYTGYRRPDLLQDAHAVADPVGEHDRALSRPRYPLAYFLSRLSVKWQRVGLLAIIVPFWRASSVRLRTRW
jgi:ABC-type spermidine/putrescine transport system permease subunit I